MRVVEGIVGDSPFSAVPHEAQLPKGTQGVRHDRLRGAEHVRQVADAELLPRERVHDLEPCRVAEHPEGLGQGDDRARTFHGSASPQYLALVEARHVAHVAGAVRRPPTGVLCR